MSSLLTNCPRCGARLRGLSTRCDACGADLVPYLTRAGASTRSVPAPSSSATPDVAYTPRASVAPPSDPTLAAATPPGLPFDYTSLERPAISETLEMTGWHSHMAMVLIAIVIVVVVKIIPGAGIFALGMDVILGPLAILMVLRGIYLAKFQQKMHQHGRQTSGVIFDRWTDKDYEGDTTYFVAYAFQAESADGVLTTVTRAEKNQKLYERYQVGDVIAVRYLVSDPSVAVVVS